MAESSIGQDQATSALSQAAMVDPPEIRLSATTFRQVVAVAWQQQFEQGQRTLARQMLAEVLKGEVEAVEKRSMK